MGAVRQADLLVVEAAEKAVIDAIRFEFSTRSTGNAASSTRRAQMLAQAAQNYRLALQLDPNFSSNDPQLLNALGYFLAEKGASSTDFQKAELLTRRALAGWDKAAKSALLKPAEVDLNRAITRDSLAWALFRQQKFAEATREQRIAVADAQKALAAGANDPNGEALAELKTHLQQIEAALDTSKTKR